jgi:hypothetical protein
LEGPPPLCLPPPPDGRHSLYTLTAEGPPPQPEAEATVGAARTTPATNAAARSRFSPPNTAVTVAGGGVDKGKGRAKFALA